MENIQNLRNSNFVIFYENVRLGAPIFFRIGFRIVVKTVRRQI